MKFYITPPLADKIKAYYLSKKKGIDSKDLQLLSQNHKKCTPKKMVNAYTKIRNDNPSILLLHNSVDKTIDVVSASENFPSDGRPVFPSDIATTRLHFAILGQERNSVVIPDIKELLAPSSRKKSHFSPQNFKITLINDMGEKKDTLSKSLLRNFIPSNLSNASFGAVLITPLGLEKSTDFGFGFIYEVKTSGSFSSTEIYQARWLSSLFMLKLAEYELNNNNEKAN